MLMLCVGLITLTGCASKTSSTQVQTVKVGVIAPLSGPPANYGEDAVHAYSFITDKWNKEHPELQIQLVIEDGKCDGKDAASAAQKLISVDNVQVIVG